ncbi:hypothetical protein [Agrobacterium sp. LMR679]|uniref:hypothetical protein n=1 Tax=Agrobacterium sp. LMR679 TaxID=3014335 RepID=UPI0022B0595F|nr:hypothetical protein [Agrobacterium sp. LMR679]MCZ4072754.1 hypothetical protein [Agrobacterium sp. LMR679]
MSTVTISPEELEELHRLAHRIPEGWRMIPSADINELLVLVKLFRDTLQYYIRRDEKTGDSEGAALKRNTLGIVMNAIAKAEGISELAMLETHLKSLISENPEKARLAASREDLRMWFLSELIAVASSTIPLTEIEAIVFQHLAPAEGGEA